MNPDPPPGLRTLGLRGNYRSDHADLVSEFYEPVLGSATEYARAVGYFSSASLKAVMDGLSSFVRRGGTMRLVCSPQLTQEDVEDIERGYAFRDVVERSVMGQLQVREDPDSASVLGQVGLLIASGVMDIQLAYVRRGDMVGIYHEKIGYVRDESGDVVAMSGSANETYMGLLANFETIEVYRSWVTGDSERVARIVTDFEALWDNTTPGLAVIPFPEAARKRLIEIAQHAPGPPITKTRRIALQAPIDLAPRDYQKDAVKAWLANRGRGIMRMATGTGKTKTAMFAAEHIMRVHRDREQPLVVVVAAPFQHLVDQWLDEVKTFGVEALGIYEKSDRWLPIAQRQLEAARLGERDVVVWVATNASYALPRFQSLLGTVKETLLFIADEAHNFGAKRYASLLPANAVYRLALSATPERWFDEWGTQALLDYFGPIVYELGLAKAIEMGALCRYYYRPRLVELDSEEMDMYVAISLKIASLLASGEDMDDPDSPLGYLLRRRASILGHASGKLPLLREDVAARKNQWAQLIYCAEGHAPEDDDDQQLDASTPSQIDEVVRMVGIELGLSIHPYVSDTPRSTRRELLQRFTAERDLQFLAAMRCLDEGVDIPDARVAYLLASSSNPRQFIQRRGRILRPAPGKTHAEVLDYIAMPNARGEEDAGIERGLMRRELERVAEFAQLSDNYADTLEVLRPLKERYDLRDL